MNTINLTQTADGLVVGRWPHMAMVTPEALALAEVDDRTLKFRCSNGGATYARYGTLTAQRISSVATLKTLHQCGFPPRLGCAALLHALALNHPLHRRPRQEAKRSALTTNRPKNKSTPELPISRIGSIHQICSALHTGIRGHSGKKRQRILRSPSIANDRAFAGAAARDSHAPLRPG